MQLEFLYNQQSKKSDFTSYLSQTLTVKNISFTEYNIFINATFPIAPLFSTTLSAMYYPEVDGFYVGSSFTYSFSSNLDFVIIAQTFQIADYTNPLTQKEGLKLYFGFLQMKYNF